MSTPAWLQEASNPVAVAAMLAIDTANPPNDFSPIPFYVQEKGEPAYPTLDHPNNPDNPNKDKQDGDVNNDAEGEEVKERRRNEQPQNEQPQSVEDEDDGSFEDDKQRTASSRDMPNRPKFRTGKVARRVGNGSVVG